MCGLVIRTCIGARGGRVDVSVGAGCHPALGVDVSANATTGAGGSSAVGIGSGSSVVGADGGRSVVGGDGGGCGAVGADGGCSVASAGGSVSMSTGTSTDGDESGDTVSFSPLSSGVRCVICHVHLQLPLSDRFQTILDVLFQVGLDDLLGTRKPTTSHLLQTRP